MDTFIRQCWFNTWRRYPLVKFYCSRQRNILFADHLMELSHFSLFYEHQRSGARGRFNSLLSHNNWPLVLNLSSVFSYHIFISYFHFNARHIMDAVSPRYFDIFLAERFINSLLFWYFHIISYHIFISSLKAAKLPFFLTVSFFTNFWLRQAHKAAFIQIYNLLNPSFLLVFLPNLSHPFLLFFFTFFLFILSWVVSFRTFLSSLHLPFHHSIIHIHPFLSSLYLPAPCNICILHYLYSRNFQYQ